jgi:hypothetical protein
MYHHVLGWNAVYCYVILLRGVVVMTLPGTYITVPVWYLPSTNYSRHRYAYTAGIPCTFPYDTSSVYSCYRTERIYKKMSYNIYAYDAS